MKAQFILTATFIALFFASCKDTAKEPSTETSIEVNTQPNAPVDEHAGHNHGAPGDNHGTQSSSIAGLNPEHGQPGHRCDISVGAPLDSPPQNMPSQPTAAAQPNTNGDGPFLVNDQAKGRIQQENGGTPTPQGNTGTNPPHGQPGHVCG